MKNADVGEVIPGRSGDLRYGAEIKLKQALDIGAAEKVAAAIKEQFFRKVRASIESRQVRVGASSHR